MNGLMIHSNRIALEMECWVGVDHCCYTTQAFFTSTLQLTYKLLQSTNNIKFLTVMHLCKYLDNNKLWQKWSILKKFDGMFVFANYLSQYCKFDWVTLLNTVAHLSGALHRMSVLIVILFLMGKFLRQEMSNISTSVNLNILSIGIWWPHILMKHFSLKDIWFPMLMLYLSLWWTLLQLMAKCFTNHTLRITGTMQQSKEHVNSLWRQYIADLACMSSLVIQGFGYHLYPMVQATWGSESRCRKFPPICGAFDSPCWREDHYFNEEICF